MINLTAIKSIYSYEMSRMKRTLIQTIAAPVLSTCLYFIVFGSAIGSKINDIDGVSYGAFIVPGLIMMFILTQSIFNASFGIYFPRFTGTIYEVLSAPISVVEIICGFIGAAASKSIIMGLLMLVTATFFVDYSISHPFWMLFFLVITSITFSLFGFLVGIIADGFEKLQLIPILIITPLAFLGGSFYSIKMLPPFWFKLSLINPVVYLINGFRWSFYGITDVNIALCLSIIFIILCLCLSLIYWVFKTGYQLKT